MSIVDIRKLPKQDIKEVQFADPTLDCIYKLKIEDNTLCFITESEELCGEIYYEEIDNLVEALRYIQKLNLEKQEKL